MKYLIVGCGISGVTAARILAEAGHQISIWERRNHIGGNMYDYMDEHGILVHQYGPHIFHTNSQTVWDFVNRFEDWKPFKLVCGATWDGKYTPTAFNFRTIDTFFPEKADELKNRLLNSYPGRKEVTVVELLENQDSEIRGYAEYLCNNDYAPYTAKQWGVSPKEIDPSVLKRVPIRLSYDESYFTDRFEAMPSHSYTRMFENLLDHRNIKVRLQKDALKELHMGNGLVTAEEEAFDRMIYTGAIDELFGLLYGKLPYRSLRFEWKYEEAESFQEAPVVAHPQAEGFTRITEYKKLPPQNVRGTTYAVEYPIPYRQGEKNEPYYPVITALSRKQYSQYKQLADRMKNMIYCGRLAKFQYFNMDQVIAEALETAGKEIHRFGRG